MEKSTIKETVLLTRCKIIQLLGMGILTIGTALTSAHAQTAPLAEWIRQVGAGG